MNEIRLVRFKESIVIACLFAVLFALTIILAAQSVIHPLSQPSHHYHVESSSTFPQPDVPVRVLPPVESD